MEAYTDFAYVYDTFMDNTPYEEWCDYLVDIFKSHNIEAELLLDLGCGTGSQAEDTIGLQNHLCGDDIGSLAAQFFIAGNVDDIHNKDLSPK